MVWYLFDLVLVTRSVGCDHGWPSGREREITRNVDTEWAMSMGRERTVRAAHPPSVQARHRSVSCQKSPRCTGFLPHSYTTWSFYSNDHWIKALFYLSAYAHIFEKERKSNILLRRVEWQTWYYGKMIIQCTLITCLVLFRTCFDER